jgi:hypothetical protein
MGKATLMSLTFTSKKVLAQQIITEKKTVYDCRCRSILKAIKKSEKYYTWYSMQTISNYSSQI